MYTYFDIGIVHFNAYIGLSYGIIVFMLDTFGYIVNGIGYW